MEVSILPNYAHQAQARSPFSPLGDKHLKMLSNNNDTICGTIQNRGG
jgi:hypothetical protein